MHRLHLSPQNKLQCNWILSINLTLLSNTQSPRGGHRGRDFMVVGITTPYAIGAYNHWWCQLEFRSGRGIQNYVIKFVSDLWQVSGFLLVFRFPSLITLTTQYNWNIVGSGIKHHKTKPQSPILTYFHLNFL